MHVGPGELALLIPLSAILLVFGIPIVAIMTAHKQKLMEMKLRMKQQADESVLAELRALKQQIDELRDTTTQYDLSFDTALRRLDGTVSGVEQRLRRVEDEVNVARVDRS